MMRPPRSVNMTLNLAPMVDVMMCLIVFFLLASRLVNAEQKPIDLPIAKAAQKSEAETTGGRLTINIQPQAGAAAGSASVQYSVVEWDGQRVVERALAPEELAPLLIARAERARAAGQPMRCRIRADRHVRYRDVEAAMRAASAAAVTQLQFSALTPNENGAAQHGPQATGSGAGP